MGAKVGSWPQNLEELHLGLLLRQTAGSLTTLDPRFGDEGRPQEGKLVQATHSS